MRRIALFLYALCLILPNVGCKKEETTTPAAGTGAATTDSDADGATDAKDDAPADPAAK